MNRFFISLILLVAAFSIASCDRFKDDNFYVACEENVEPFAYYDSEGNLTGFEVELIKAIAVNQNVKIKLRPMDFTSLMSRIESGNGRIDGAIALVSRTTARGRTMDFSDHYFESAIAIGVRKATQGIASIEDLRGKRVAMKRGTFIHEYAKMLNDNISLSVSPFDHVEEAFKALQDGTVDAVLEEKPLIEYRIKKGSDLKIAYTCSPNQVFCLVVPKRVYKETYEYYDSRKTGSENLVIDFNAGLKNLRENGTYQSIYDKYFK